MSGRTAKSSQPWSWWNQVPVSRRKLLQLGSLGLGGMGLTLPRLLASDATGGQRLGPSLADNCILLFLNGGPSHLDMWDMKPNAPEGIRGEFQPIATSVVDYQMCEHLPRLARQAHLATIVRSMNHTVNNSHAAAVYASLTGHDRGEQGGGTKSTDHPSLGSIMARLRPTAANVVPHVCLPYMTKEGAGGPPQPGFFGGFLGSSLDPLFVLKDPNAPDFRVPELTLQNEVSADRLTARRRLFETADGSVAQGPSASKEMSRMQARALDLLTSEHTQRAFRLTDESDATRDSYGRNIYGQSTLLARRLVEAGTRIVTISWAPDANATWDTHGSNFATLKNTLLPQFDSACASLVSDLAERGMLERTIVAVLGDFGRTPRINANNGGRDHWNFCYSVMLIGGGFQQGLIHGTSDTTGAFPASHPLVPGDIISTIYAALGVDPTTDIHDLFMRPYRVVPAGEIAPNLLIRRT
ncbi:DUF1501 domain-containing protein [Schlesneria paludicola]|uniref:DUF1501 domain-containing protein n=1 Tax=Schlesneria paludicola TaxID=360056 RepID=UPI000299EA21|nr:DUF1501 domain-containing protein [Schlesneria paludicola]